VRKIDALLNRDGYTVRGVQQLLGKEVGGDVGTPIDTLRAIRDLLARALAEDGA